MAYFGVIFFANMGGGVVRIIFMQFLRNHRTCGFWIPSVVIRALGLSYWPLLCRLIFAKGCEFLLVSLEEGFGVGCAGGACFSSGK